MLRLGVRRYADCDESRRDNVEHAQVRILRTLMVLGSSRSPRIFSRASLFGFTNGCFGRRLARKRLVPDEDERRLRVLIDLAHPFVARAVADGDARHGSSFGQRDFNIRADHGGVRAVCEGVAEGHAPVHHWRAQDFHPRRQRHEQPIIQAYRGERSVERRRPGRENVLKESRLYLESGTCSSRHQGDCGAS